MAQASRLLVSDALDTTSKIEEDLRKDFEFVSKIMDDAGENNVDEIVQRLVTLGSQGKDAYKSMMRGLLYILLVDPGNAPLTWRLTTAASSDGCEWIGVGLQELLSSVSDRLIPVVQQQAMFVCQKLVELNASRAESVVLVMLRLCRGGDLSEKNIRNCTMLLSILENNWEWLLDQGRLPALSFFKYGRLLADLVNTPHKSLLRRQAKFCADLWHSSRGSDCSAGGRDIIRVLRSISKVDEIKVIWRSIFNPNGTKDMTKLLTMLTQKTPSNLIRSLIDPALERDLMFMLSSVELAGAPRYQNWFATRYFKTLESESLVADIIRVIICTFHPTNEMLRSSTIQRYQVLAWLLKCTRSMAAASEAKLAIFLDWFTFSSKTDIMFIEPGVLLLQRSLKHHPALSCTLLEFLCHIVEAFGPPNSGSVVKDHFCHGIETAFTTAATLGVVPSLVQLLSSPLYSAELLSSVQSTFSRIGSRNHSNPALQDAGSSNTSGGGFLKMLARLESEYVDHPSRASIIEMIVKHFCEMTDAPDVETYQKLTSSIHESIRISLEGAIPGKLLRAPHVVLFDYTSNTTGWGEAPKINCSPDQRLIVILRGLIEMIPSIGYFFLAHIQSRVKERKWKLSDRLVQDRLFRQWNNLTRSYVAFAATFSGSIVCDDDELLSQCILRDLTKCVAEDGIIDTFISLVPFVLTHFPRSSIGLPRLVHLIVGYIDAGQMHTLTSQLLRNEFRLFIHPAAPSALNGVVKASLSWESLEQIFFWELLDAELSTSNDTTLIVQLVDSLNGESPPEAMSGLTRIVKRVPPHADILEAFLNDDRFMRNVTVSTLHCWMGNHAGKFTETLALLLCRVAARVGVTGPRVQEALGPHIQTSTNSEDAINRLIVLAKIVEAEWTVAPWGQNRLDSHFKVQVLVNLARDIYRDRSCAELLKQSLEILFSISNLQGGKNNMKNSEPVSEQSKRRKMESNR